MVQTHSSTCMPIPCYPVGTHDPGGHHVWGLRCIISVVCELCGQVGAVGCLGASSSLLAQAVCASSSLQCGLCGRVGAVSHMDALGALLSLLEQAVGMSSLDA